MRVLTDALGRGLNGAIRLNCPVEGIEQDGDGWSIASPAGRELYGSVLFSSPAHSLLKMAAGPELAPAMRSFRQVYYPPIARLAFGFNRSQVAHPLDGFGALVPRKESMNLLGVLFSSSMFENRAPRDRVLLTVFAGGARDPQLLHQSADRIAEMALDDLRSLLGIAGAPTFMDAKIIERSIPQYNVGYGAVKELIRGIETRCPGLFFAGNFSHGISVSDCIAGGAAAAEKVAERCHVGSLEYA